jgi:Mrp family chromosome partitioning ATPase/capsular polysaccharide biosynthesis protein
MASKRVIRRGIAITIASVLLTVGMAMLFSFVLGRTYSAEAQLVVTPLASEDPVYAGLPVIQNSSDPTRDVSTLTAYVETQDVGVEAARILEQAGFTPTQIARAAEKLSIEPVASSYLVAIVATADNPSSAATIANAYAQATVTVRKERFNAQLEPKLARAQNALRALPTAGPDAAAADPIREQVVGQVSQLQGMLGAEDPSFQILSSAVPAQEASGPGLPIVLGAAGIAGLLLGLVLSAAYNAAQVRRLDNDRELLNAFDLPILGHIPPVRNPPATVLTPNLLRASAWQSYGALSQQIETLRSDRSTSRVLAFTGPGAGNGTTTSALNTATQLAESGYSVLLIDTDLRRHSLSDVIGFSPPHGIRAALERRVSLRSAAIRWRKDFHLDLLLVNVVEGASTNATSADNVRRLLAQVSGGWDFVVVDVARPAQGRGTSPFIATADDVIVTVHPGHTPMAELEELMELFALDEIEPRGFLVVGGRRVRDVRKSIPVQQTREPVDERDVPVPENA